MIKTKKEYEAYHPYFHVNWPEKKSGKHGEYTIPPFNGKDIYETIEALRKVARAAGELDLTLPDPALVKEVGIIEKHMRLIDLLNALPDWLLK